MWDEIEGVEEVMEGDIYIDGSCTTGPFKELRRAAFAVVAMKEDGQVTATASSPLWRSLPQTPQAAEYVALAAAVQLITGKSKIFCDCKNVVNDAQDIRSGARNGKKQYAGILRDILKHEEKWKLVEGVTKVKAHQEIKSIQGEEERRRAQGNDHADGSAKAAVKRHPWQSRQGELILEATLEKAKAIIRLVGEALPKWPAKKNRLQGKGERSREETDRVPEEGRRLHQWEWIEQAWRCTRCMQCCFVRHMKKRLRYQRCEGDTEEAKLMKLKERHHTTARSLGSGLPLIFCLKCGAWTTRRMYKLAAACKAQRTRAGEQALSHIKQGRHPWLARGEKVEQRKAIGQGTWTPAEDGRAKRLRRGRRTEMREEEDAKRGEEEAAEAMTSADRSASGEQRTAEATRTAETSVAGSFSYGGSVSSGHDTRPLPQRTFSSLTEDVAGPSPQSKRRRLRGKQPPAENAVMRAGLAEDVKPQAKRRKY